MKLAGELRPGRPHIICRPMIPAQAPRPPQPGIGVGSRAVVSPAARSPGQLAAGQCCQSSPHLDLPACSPESPGGRAPSSPASLETRLARPRILRLFTQVEAKRRRVFGIWAFLRTVKPIFSLTLDCGFSSPDPGCRHSCRSFPLATLIFSGNHFHSKPGVQSAAKCSLLCFNNDKFILKKQPAVRFNFFPNS